MSETGSSHVVRWIVAIVVALCLVALLAWARGEPGVGGRTPGPDDASAVSAPFGSDVR